jgi:hypothetical protein
MTDASNVQGVAATMKRLFPDGISIKVRTGEKNADGKHLARRVDMEPWNWCDEFLAMVFDAGARGVVAEKLNNVPGEDGKKAKAAADLFAAADRGEIPADCAGRVRVAGAGGMDAADAAIYRDGLAWIGALLAGKAAKQGKGGTGAGGRFIAADWADMAKGGALEAVFDGKGNADSGRVVEFVKVHNAPMADAARARVEAARKPDGLSI